MGKYEEALERARQGKPIDEVFPELKESEDERIRKGLIEIFNSALGQDFLQRKAGLDRDKVIAYLEKHKEPKPIPDKFSGLKSLLLQYLQSAANRKDDAEIESDTDLWGRKILDYVWKCEDKKQKEQKPASISCSHENDKPADDKAFEEWIDGVWKHNKVNNPYSYDKGDEIQFDEQGFKMFCHLIRKMNQQKSVEWSEGGEKIRAKLLSYFNGFTESTAFGRQEVLDIRHWLKSLRPQPKQKWSEEDENYYDTIVRKLQVLGDDSGLTTNQIDFLDKHRPQPHWKPSEEQMIALYKAAQESPIIKENGNYLYDLYDDLRKLM